MKEMETNKSIKHFADFAEVGIKHFAEVEISNTGINIYFLSKAIANSKGKVTSNREVSDINVSNVKRKYRKHIHRTRWTLEEDTKLFNLRSQNVSLDEIARQLGRSKPSISDRLCSLKYRYKPTIKPQLINKAITKTRKHKKWTTQEINTLKRLKAQGMSMTEIAKILNRSIASIGNRASVVKAYKHYKYGLKFTPKGKVIHPSDITEVLQE